LCGYEFAFSPLYDPNMPETIPRAIVLRQMVVNVAAVVVTAVRLVVVTIMWLFVLPYLVYWVTRFYFWSGQSVSFGAPNHQHNVTMDGAYNATDMFALGVRRFQEFDTWKDWYLHARDNGTVVPVSSYTGLLDGSTNMALVLYSVVRIALKMGVEALRLGLGIQISEQQLNSLVEMVMEFNVKSMEGDMVTVIALLAFMAVFMLRDWIVTNAPVDDDMLDEVEEQINQGPIDQEQANLERIDQQQLQPAAEPPQLLQVEGRPIEAENPQHRPLFEHPPNEVPALEDLQPNERPVRRYPTDNRLDPESVALLRAARRLHFVEQRDVIGIGKDEVEPARKLSEESSNISDDARKSVDDSESNADKPQVDSFADLMKTLPEELRPAAYVPGETSGRHERSQSEQRTGWAYADEAFDDQSSNDSDSNSNSSSDYDADASAVSVDEYARTMEAATDEWLRSDSIGVLPAYTHADENSSSGSRDEPGAEVVASLPESEDAWSFVNRGESSHSAVGGSQRTDDAGSAQLPATFTGESSRAIYAHARPDGANEAASSSSSNSDSDNGDGLEVERLRAAEEAAQRFRQERAGNNRVAAAVAEPNGDGDGDRQPVWRDAGLVLNDEEIDAGDMGAEDIWEAIGLRGPLVNSLQYFVLVLIVVGTVLAFFAWLPYICGRAFVALNPIRVVFYGAHVLFTAIDTVGELVLDLLPALVWERLRPVLVGITNSLGPAVVSPLAAVVPGLQSALAAADGLMWDKLTSPAVQQLVLECVRGSWVVRILFPWTSTGPTRTVDAMRELSPELNLLSWERQLWQRLVRAGIPVDSIAERLTRAAAGATLDDRMLMIGIGHLLGVATAWLIVTYTPRALRRGALYSSARMLLRMAKIVFFICVELVAFPVLCGYCLDVSLMPLLASASLGSRVAVLSAHRWTALFTHWLLGLLFMVHFARFVLHCRHVMRPGLLWFIRDPNDPEFHPMREILEDRMLPQQYNIARSALMYCGIILACVGLTALVAVRTTHGVFPVQWRADARFSDHPTSILLMVFLLPVAVTWGRPNEVLHALFSRWWRVAAHATRLTEFVLGERSILDEGEWTLRRAPWLPVLMPRVWMPTQVVESAFAAFNGVDEARAGDVPDALPTGEYRQQLQLAIDTALAASHPHVMFTLGSGDNYRVPAVDTVPVVPGRTMLVHVDDHGRAAQDRYDYEAADDPELRAAAEREGRELPAAAPDSSYRDRRFRREHYTVVYVPPYLRVRMCAVLALGWLAVAVLSSATLVLSLIIGRSAYSYMSGLPLHDMYALSIGLLVLLVIAVLVFRVSVFLQEAAGRDATEWTRDLQRRLQQVASAVWKVAFMAAVFFGVVPAVYGLVVEVYFVVLLRYAAASPEFDAAFERSLLQAMAHNWMFGVLHVWVGLSLLRVFPQWPWGRQFERLFAGPPHAWRVGRATVVFALPVVGASLLATAVPFAVAIAIMWYRGVLSTEAIKRTVLLHDLEVLALSVKLVIVAVLLVLAVWQACLLYRKWSRSARDRAYLVGQQLHNLEADAPVAVEQSVTTEQPTDVEQPVAL
ncbi:hypothetical protein LPJ70_001989, partial [Coemansia sp. RSA 2708]